MMNFTQKNDHFHSGKGSFNQVIVIDEQFSELNVTRSIVAVFGGDYPMPLTNTFQGSVVEVAKRTNSTLVAIEHRYFGKSKPSTQNINYNTVSNALADFASILGEFKAAANNPRVLVVGDYYGGSLAAWFRIKYPNIADASWSSSAPIKSEREYFQFDVQMGKRLESVSEKCLNNTQQMLKNADDILFNGGDKKYLIDTFGFDVSYGVPSDTTVAYTLAEGIDLICQMNHVEEFCENSLSFEHYAKVFKKSLIEDGSSIIFFDIKLMLDYSTTARFYMQCNELGLFHTYSNSSKYALRSPRINLEYYDDCCRNNFRSLSQPEELFNQVFDPKNADLSSMIFTYQEYDRYLPLGMLSSSPNVFRKQVHGGYERWDLCGNQKNDTSEIIEAREIIVRKAVDLLIDSCSSKCKNGYCQLNQCICESNFIGEFCNVSVVSSRTFTIFSAVATLVPTIIMVTLAILGWIIFATEAGRLSNIITSFV